MVSAATPTHSFCFQLCGLTLQLHHVSSNTGASSGGVGVVYGWRSAGLMTRVQEEAKPPSEPQMDYRKLRDLLEGRWTS